MKNVWVVYDSTPELVLGVFSTEQKAEAFALARAKQQGKEDNAEMYIVWGEFEIDSWDSESLGYY